MSNKLSLKVLAYLCYLHCKISLVFCVKYIHILLVAALASIRSYMPFANVLCNQHIGHHSVAVNYIEASDNSVMTPEEA